MHLRNLATAIGALGLVATPIVVQAADAPVARDAASMSESEELAGGSSVIIALLALAAVVGGVLIAIEDDEEPTSP